MPRTLPQDKHERGQIDYSRTGSVPYGKQRVKMLLLLRQLYFFGEAEEDDRSQEPREAVISVDGKEKHRDDQRGACIIEFASGQHDDQVNVDDVEALPPSPRLKRSDSLFNGSRRFRPDKRVKLRRTFIQHERLLVSEIYITTHVAPTEGKIADAMSRRPPPPPVGQRPSAGLMEPGCMARSAGQSVL